MNDKWHKIRRAQRRQAELGKIPEELNIEKKELDIILHSDNIEEMSLEELDLFNNILDRIESSLEKAGQFKDYTPPKLES